MDALDCTHAGTAAGRVCRHLLADREGGHLRDFSGIGLAFDLICTECGRGGVVPPGELRTACRECFQRIQEEGSWEGFARRPEAIERASGLSFAHETVRLTASPPGRILDVQPVAYVDRNLWIALAQAGEILRLDLDDGSSEVLCRLPPSGLDLSQPITLTLSDDGRLAAVTATLGRHGLVVDLASGKTTMPLERDDYMNEHCTFPAAFFEADGRTLLIHATAWNRLDVSDPLTGALLTDRSPTSYARGEERPEHYLDYFHCRLAVSPGGRRVAEDGWVWHPVGMVAAWDLRPWLEGNPWESEDGPSRKVLCHRYYHWDSLLCWLGEDRLAVWGYGEDDEWLIPAVRIFDAGSGEEVRWFPGPKGNLAFDEHLFSFDPAEGTAIWDVETGERLLREEGFRPHRYHRAARSFLTPGADGTFQVSRLRGRPVDPGWLSANGGTVARLARAIAQERDFDSLPVLADALEEAGCQDQAVLGHCRRPGPHSRRCWVLDMLLDGR